MDNSYLSSIRQPFFKGIIVYQTLKRITGNNVFNTPRLSTAELNKLENGVPQGDVARLGYQAPVWVPDHRVTMCQQCSTDFTLVHRRHHCRACGQVDT